MDDFFNPLSFFLGTLFGVLSLFAVLMLGCWWDERKLHQARERELQSSRAGHEGREWW